MKNRWITILVLAQVLVSLVAISAYLIVRATGEGETSSATDTTSQSGVASAPLVFTGVAPLSQPLVRANPARTGFYDSKEPGRPQSVKWKFADNVAPVSQWQVIAGDTAYICAVDGKVFAVDTATGTERWRVTVANMTNADPVVDGDTLYFISDALYALDTAQGELKWKYDTTKNYDSTGLLAADGMVYFLKPNGLDALDARTGTLLWNYPISNEAYMTEPALADGRIFFGGRGATGIAGTHSLYAVDARTGKELWRYSLQEGMESWPCVADGVVYFSSYWLHEDMTDTLDWMPDSGKGAVHAVDARDGKEIWKIDIEDGDENNLSWPLVAAGNLLFLFRTPEEIKTEDTISYIQALDSRDGHEIWRKDIGDMDTYLSAAGTSVFAMARISQDKRTAPFHERLYAFDAATGKEKWAWDSDEPYIYGEIIVQDGAIYLNADGLVALR